MQTYPPGGDLEAAPGADAWVFAPVDLPRLAAADLLRRISDEQTRRGGAFGWDRLLPLYNEHLLLVGRVPLAVPLVAEAPVFLYRSDLVASPAWQARFTNWQQKHPSPDHPPAPLRAPATWEEVARQAEFFRDEHPSGHAGPSLPPLPAADAALERLFATVAASTGRRAVRPDEAHGPDYRDELFSFYFDQGSGAPRIDAPGFVRALELLVRLRGCRPAEPAASPERAFREGQAVLGFAEAGVLARLQQRSALRDRFGVCAVPGAETFFTASGKRQTRTGTVNRVPYLGGAGWLVAVPRSARSAEAAEALLADLAGPVRSAEIALEPRWGGGATRTDVLQRDRWDAFDLDEPRTRELRGAVTGTLLHAALENPVFVLRLPNAVAFRTDLVAGLRRALLRERSAQEALAEVRRRWQAQIDRRGAAAHLRDYRLGLGLLED